MKHKSDKKYITLKGNIAFLDKEVSGYAYLIKKDDIKSTSNKEDKNIILVTEATYPNYLPLMLISKGIITEVGGILSHAAIVAREFNIPCVVGVKGILDIIKDGDLIEIKKNGVILVYHE